MMNVEYIPIDSNNINLVHQFLQKDIDTNFTYFSKRDVSIVLGHCYTVICKHENNIIGYGHIDHKENIYWLGICITNDNKGRGFGTNLLQHLIDFTIRQSINCIQLSVNVNNQIAIRLYKKHLFDIEEIHDNYYIMKRYNNTLLLNVSLGEALDKLTILDIKIDKIKDERRWEVEKEYNYIKKSTEHFNTKLLRYYYNQLKQINLVIWELQDIVRNNKNNIAQNCIDILKENDRRFQVKNKINTVTSSKFKEQKGYQKKTGYILTHLGLGDNITAVPAVNFLTTLYDKVVVVCAENHISNMKLFYQHDKSIEFLPVDKNNPSDIPLFIRYGICGQDYDVYRCGYYCTDVVKDIPFSFYDDLKFNRKIFYEYFYLPELDESRLLYESIGNNKYILVNNQSSTGEVFTIDFIENRFNIDKNKILFINPSVSIYPEYHNFYASSKACVMRPLLYYVHLLKNASIIVLSDSSMFCMAIHADISTDECYYVSRENANYDHLYLPENGFTSSNGKKIFKKLM